MPLEDTVQLFATLNVALFDTAVACWDARYFYNFWRPATAMARAGKHANSDTEADVNWTSLLTTPAHPEYVSGHSAFSSAAATVLTECLGTDAVTFIVRSDTLPKEQRKFTSLQACVEERGTSRV